MFKKYICVKFLKLIRKAFYNDETMVMKIHSEECLKCVHSRVHMIDGGLDRKVFCLKGHIYPDGKCNDFGLFIYECLD